MKLYGMAVSTPVNKVRFVANALGLDYEFVETNVMAGETRTPEYLRMHPAGKVPVIEIDGKYLFESNAIIRYLADRQNSPLYPKDLWQRAQVDQWIDFATIHIGGAVGKVLFNRLLAPLMKVPVDENSLREGLKFLDRFLPVVEEQLGKSAYLAGPSLTLADFVLLTYLDPFEVVGVDLKPYPKIGQWRDGLKKQAFYTKCFNDYRDLVAAAKSS